MKRVIVDYAKLTHEILNLLVEKFPDGYDDSNIISFRNAKNELIEAVEVHTDDTIYLVKVSTKLSERIENYDEDDELLLDEAAEPIKGLDLEDDIEDDDDEDDDNHDKPDADSGDDDDDDDTDEKDLIDEGDDHDDED
jgi:hypothetical protein